MRRTATARSGLLAALCLLLPAACSGGDGGGPQPTASADGEIVVASGLDVTGSDGVRQQLIAQWNQTTDGRRHPARLVELPGSADQQRSQLLGALQSGGASYDVVNLDVTWIPEFAQARLISPLDRQAELRKDLADDFIPSVADTAVWKHHTYAVPFNSDVGLLYYRPDVLRKAGVAASDFPDSTTSWRQLEQLIATVDAAPAADRPKGYEKGWTSQLGPYEGFTVNAIEAFASADVQLTDADGHYTAHPADLRTGLLALKERAQSLYTLPAALSSHEAESLSDFAAGKTVFLRHWPYAYRLLPQSLSNDQLAVARMPGSAVLGGQDLAVAAGSPRAKYALALIRFLTGKSNERCLLDAGFAATRKSAYDDPSVRCGLPAAPTGSASPSASAETHDMPRDGDGRPADASRVLSALTTAVQRPRTPYYGAFTQILQSELHPWLSGSGPPDLDKVADTLDRDLARALKGK